MRKTVGIIGGIAPESTIAYYRQIIERYREATGGGNPSIIINSIDLTKMLGLVGSKDFARLIDYLSEEMNRLANAGADFGVFASRRARGSRSSASWSPRLAQRKDSA